MSEPTTPRQRNMLSIDLPVKVVEGSILHRLPMVLAHYRACRRVLFGALVASFLLACLAVVKPELRRACIGGSVLVLMAADWWLLGRQRGLLREWRDYGVLHSAWLAGEPEEITIAASSGEPRLGLMRLPLVLLYTNPLTVAAALDSMSVILYGYAAQMALAPPAAWYVGRQLATHVSIHAVDLRRLTAPLSDDILVAKGVFSAAVACGALILVLGEGIPVAKTILSLAILAFIAAAAWAALRIRAGLEELREGMPLQTRWRRFLRIEEPAPGEEPRP